MQRLLLCDTHKYQMYENQQKHGIGTHTKWNQQKHKLYILILIFSFRNITILSISLYVFIRTLTEFLPNSEVFNLDELFPNTKLMTMRDGAQNEPNHKPKLKKTNGKQQQIKPCNIVTENQTDPISTSSSQHISS